MVRKSTFTLIELLVVLAIIGVLVTLLLPSLSRAREKGMRVVCISQLKQTAVAKSLYLQDNNLRIHSDSLPGTDLKAPGKQWIGKEGVQANGSISTMWSARVKQRPLNIYLKHTTDGVPLKLALCPLEFRGVGAYKGTGSSYFGNSNTNATGAGYKSLRNLFLQQINAPSKTILIAESGANALAEGYGIDSEFLRKNHSIGKLVYPIAKADGSALEHNFVFGGEGTRWQSKSANFNNF